MYIYVNTYLCIYVYMCIYINTYIVHIDLYGYTNHEFLFVVSLTNFIFFCGSRSIARVVRLRGCTGSDVRTIGKLHFLFFHQLRFLFCRCRHIARRLDYYGARTYMMCKISLSFHSRTPFFCVGADTLRGWLEYDVAGGGSDVRFTNLCDVVLKVDCATHTARLHTHGNAAHTLQHPYWIHERVRYCVEVCVWYCVKSLNMKHVHTYACIHMCNNYMCPYMWICMEIYTFLYVCITMWCLYVYTCIYVYYI